MESTSTPRLSQTAEMASLKNKKDTKYNQFSLNFLILCAWFLLRKATWYAWVKSNLNRDVEKVFTDTQFFRRFPQRSRIGLSEKQKRYKIQSIQPKFPYLNSNQKRNGLYEKNGSNLSASCCQIKGNMVSKSICLLDTEVSHTILKTS